MNILFFSTYRISPFFGGVERVTGQIVDGLHRIGGYRCYSVYTEEHGMPPYAGMDGLLKISPTGQNKEELIRFIDVNHIDIVINQHSPDYCRLLKTAVEESAGRPYLIYCYHASPGERIKVTTWSYYLSFFVRRSGIINVIKSTLRCMKYPFDRVVVPIRYKSKCRMIYRNNDTVVLLSRHYMDSWKRLAGVKGDKLAFMNNCLTYDTFADRESIRLKKRMVLIVCRFVEERKQLYLAFKIWQMIEKNPGSRAWKLVIVGDGPDYSYYSQLIGRLRLRNVELKGRQDPLEYYKQASVFMMTSRFEGWPMTLNEAKQNGVVPLAFNTYDALPELIENSVDGFIIEPYNLHEYVVRLEVLMTNKDMRDRMALKAVEASGKFMAEAVCKQWDTLFKQCVKHQSYN